MINWNISKEHAQALLQLLGAQPTSTGAYPLLMDLTAQTEAQLNLPQEIPNAEENE